MKAVSAPLLALLHGGTSFAMADLYAFSLVGGDALHYTSADTALAWSGHTYRPVAIKRSGIRERAGMSADELTVEMFPADELASGVPLLQAARRGLFDGARLELRRAFLPAWGSPITGAIVRFGGRVAEIEPSRSAVRFAVHSDLELLDTKLPRRLYQPGCIHTLFDAGCTLAKAAHAATGSVTGTSTTTTIAVSLAQPAGYFSLGTVTFATGPNAGQTRSVKSHTAGVLVLAAPLPAAPAAGTTFTAYPGCDKTLSTCQTRFANRPNFRGHPYIPKPETAF